MTPTQAIVALAVQLFAPNTSTHEVKCLADNLYYEARGEGVAGMTAVALVASNRVSHSKYPSTYCAVVYQPWQFSWVKKPHYPVANFDAYFSAARISALVVSGRIKRPYFTALYYFNPHCANPPWQWKKQYVATVGAHDFYAEVN